MSKKKKTNIVIWVLIILLIMTSILFVSVIDKKSNEHSDCLCTYDELEIMYSTLDNELFFNDFDKKVEKVTCVDDRSVLYENSIVKIDSSLHNIASADLTNYTKKVIVSFEDGSIAKSTLTSYTKVIDEENDLSVLVDDVATSNTIVSGYYILANNIEHTGFWKGNIYNPYSFFGGVFDGNGYYVDLQLGTGGLFSGLTTNATIKNVAILINNVSSISNNSDARYILSKSSLGLGIIKEIFINDVYFDINVNACLKAGYNMSIMASSGSQAVSYNNVVIDYADGVLEKLTGPHEQYGVFVNYFNYVYFINGDDITGDGVSDLKYSIENSFKNTFYINKDFKYAGGHYSNGVLQNLMFAENDIELMIDEVAQTKKVYIPGLFRYDDYITMASNNLDLSSFDSNCWDVSSGFPKFKSLFWKYGV